MCRYNEYQTDNSCVIADLLRTECIFAEYLFTVAASPIITAYLRAGARKKLWYKKEEVGAVIVTCGGICPGLNNIIREIVVTLYDFLSIPFS